MLSLLNWKETKACKTDADEPKKLALRDSIPTSPACQMSMVLATVMHHLFFFPTEGVKSISSRCHLGSFSDYNCPRSGIITAAFCKQVFKVLTLSPLSITFLFIGKTIVATAKKTSCFQLKKWQLRITTSIQFFFLDCAPVFVNERPRSEMNSTRIHTLPCRINKKQASTRRVPNWGNTIDYSLVVISFPQRWFGHLCFQIVNIALQKTTESFFFYTEYFSFCSLKRDCLWLLFFQIAHIIDSKTRKRQTLVCRIHADQLLNQKNRLSSFLSDYYLTSCQI